VLPQLEAYLLSCGCRGKSIFARRLEELKPLTVNLQLGTERK
jgi:hypothetical protein